jgi:son of sevenless
VIVHMPLKVPCRPSHPNSKEFLDISSLDVARQLTVVESRLYLRIKDRECFRRSRGETWNTDSITAITRYSDQVSVIHFGPSIFLLTTGVDSYLGSVFCSVGRICVVAGVSTEVFHYTCGCKPSRDFLIELRLNAPQNCRHIQNYSTMVSIIAGLNAATVRRLKRSWDLVTPRYLIKFNTCEAIIDPHRNFKNYRHTLANISPPCVPYIGE